MSEDLQALLEKINAEGVQKAEARGKEIISAAKHQADEIISAAGKQAEEIKAGAERDAEALKQRTVNTLQQTARDMILQLKVNLEKRISAVVGEASAQALTPEFMAQLVKELAAAFAADPDSQISVISAVKDVDALQKALRSALADSFCKEPVVLGAPRMEGGLEVDVQDGKLYFDFTLETLTSLVASYAGSRLNEIFEAR